MGFCGTCFNKGVVTLKAGATVRPSGIAAQEGSRKGGSVAVGFGRLASSARVAVNPGVPSPRAVQGPLLNGIARVVSRRQGVIVLNAGVTGHSLKSRNFWRQGQEGWGTGSGLR